MMTNRHPIPPQHPTPVPQTTSSTPSPEPPAAQQAQPPQTPQASSHPGSPQPGCPEPPAVPLAQHPSRHPLPQPPQCWGHPLGPRGPAPAPASPLDPPCVGPCTRMCMCVYMCAHLRVFTGLRGARGCDSQVPMSVATQWPCPWMPLAPGFGPSLGAAVCRQGEGEPSPVGICRGSASRDPREWPQHHARAPFVSPLHTPAPHPPWPCPPAFSTARAVIALIGIAGPERPHLEPPILATWGWGAI